LPVSPRRARSRSAPPASGAAATARGAGRSARKRTATAPVPSAPGARCPAPDRSAATGRARRPRPRARRRSPRRSAVQRRPRYPGTDSRPQQIKIPDRPRLLQQKGPHFNFLGNFCRRSRSRTSGPKPAGIQINLCRFRPRTSSGCLSSLSRRSRAAEQQGYRAGFAVDSTLMRAGSVSALRASSTIRAHKRKNSSTVRFPSLSQSLGAGNDRGGAAARWNWRILAELQPDNPLASAGQGKMPIKEDAERQHYLAALCAPSHPTNQPVRMQRSSLPFRTRVSTPSPSCLIATTS
jgi:hypothetical protein